MLTLTVPVLINEDVLKASCDDLKCTVLNSTSFCTSLIVAEKVSETSKNCLMREVGTETGCGAHASNLSTLKADLYEIDASLIYIVSSKSI